MTSPSLPGGCSDIDNTSSQNTCFFAFQQQNTKRGRNSPSEIESFDGKFIMEGSTGDGREKGSHIQF